MTDHDNDFKFLDETGFEDDEDDVDIDILDAPPSNKSNRIDDSLYISLNKEIKLSLLLNQKESLLKYLNNINVNSELVNLLNDNINLIISNEISNNNSNVSSNNENNQISVNQGINIESNFVKNTQIYLSESVSLYHKINQKDTIINNKSEYLTSKDKYRVKRFKKVLEEPKITIPSVQSEFIQITAPKEEIEKRVKNFNLLKKSENGKYNIIEFIEEPDEMVASNNNGNNGSSGASNSEGNNRDSNLTTSTSRTSAVPPSKMKITRTYNLSGPLDNVTDNNIQQPYIDDRLSILENHLKLSVPPVPLEIYQRVKLIEQKMLYLEEKNPSIFKDLNAELSRNSTVDHSSKSKS